MAYSLFYESIEEAASRFRSWDKNQAISIISHLDADGISSSAILTHLMNCENRKYTISIYPQLTEDEISQIAAEDTKHVIFSDFGSGQLKLIKKFLKSKEVIILDHHEIDKTDFPNNIIHVNPHSFGIDGSREISGAGVSFLFAKAIDEKYSCLAHLAILGAIGDIQENNGFLKLNNDILETAISVGKIKKNKSLKFFGMQTRPIHKVLEYCSNPHIPGISGSESGAIQFLQDIGIEPKKGSRWRTMAEMDEEEVKKLISGIVMRRLGNLKPEDIIGFSYVFPGEKEGTVLYDAREFATLLNACGRMEKASVGIGACLGNPEDKRKALQTLSEYKKEIVTAIDWYKNSEQSEDIIKGKNFVILNAKNKISATVIGTLASIISKSNFIEDDNYILSMARSKNGKTKVSLRLKSSRDDIDLREIVKELAEKIGGEAGGHMKAAGAVIPTEKEDELIQIAAETLPRFSL